MQKTEHLYLFTLEVIPLIVGELYNPLPSHLTLISRFYSHETSEQITAMVHDLFNETRSIDLLFQKSTEIGPKQTPVHIIEPSTELKLLHAKLLKILDENDVTYTQPQFIGNGWRPHVSERENDNFITGKSQLSKYAYLIEVFIQNENHLRVVRQKFKLTSR